MFFCFLMVKRRASTFITVSPKTAIFEKAVNLSSCKDTYNISMHQIKLFFSLFYLALNNSKFGFSFQFSVLSARG